MMPILTIIAFSALVVAIVSTFFAIKGKHQLYWIATIGIYIFSFLAGFSIGQITVGLTFLPLALAVGYSLNLIKNGLSFTIFLVIGFLVGLIMVFFVDDVWLFFPFLILN